MALVTIDQLTIGFRGPPLLDEVTCQIEAGQRIGLLGRNGAGKTTFMRVLCGDVEPDHGQILMAPDATVSLLPQDVPQDLHGTVHDIVAAGLRPADIETAWKGEQNLERIVSEMDLDAAAEFDLLSSGMKRRVLLARSLAGEPDILLLDEPTNHLDIDSIGWLEEFLLRWNTTLIFVTHDRMFLRKLATRILEVDRGRLFDWSCDYDTFLVRKEAALAAEEKQNALFDKKLAQEEVWIRQGIKARRTRNEGRVRALKRMREEHHARRTTEGKVRMKIHEGQRSGNLIAKVERIGFAYDDQTIVDDFSTIIMRGDKVGVIGPNGVGKTTLLRLLLGQLAPQQGSVRLGTNLDIAYFDQLRAQLDGDETVEENVGQGHTSITVGGQQKHIIGYLQDFLFAPDRARTPVRFLSGGERNRVLLARLFAKPANVIVLDEPTNDLDAETLELLEERLVEFNGTVLVVSHDREFLNNVATSTIVFENGGVKEYDGGYDDWVRQRSAASEEAPPAKPAPNKIPTKTEAKQKRRLSFNDQRELDALPATIEQLETDIAAVHEVMAGAGFYQRPHTEIAAQQAKLADFDAQLAIVYKRWEELEPHG